MDLGLADRRVLITGGAGSIGRVLCRAFAAERARVAVHHHTGAQRAAELLAVLNSAGAGRSDSSPSRHISVAADLTDEAQTVAAFEQIQRAWGGLDVLVANAGWWPREATPILDLPLARWQATLAANLTASFLCCREFLRLARRVSQPSDPAIVLIGSTAGVFGEADHADYAAAKAALHTGLAKSLKNEVTRHWPTGRVNVVHPGWTVNDHNAASLADPAVLARVVATRAQPRVGRPEDVAAAVLFLASSTAAGHLTGEAITVSGGMEGRLLRPPN